MPNGKSRSCKSTAGRSGDIHFKGLPVPVRTTSDKHPDGRFTAYDGDKARKKRTFLCTAPDGGIFDVESLSPKEIADGVEMLVPLVRPYGCGPVAPADDIVLRTYDRILEVRNEVRFTELGLAIGDRTFKRCYQQACRDKARYNSAPDSLRREADNAKHKGVKFVFDNNKHTFGGVTYPGIRKAGAGDVPDGVLRKPEYAVQKAFEYLNDKHWHRYLFPVGCFFFEKVPETHQGWKDWKLGLQTPRNTEFCISPYSVTAADILYLCNTIGYMERYIYIIGIILWAKSYGCNLLRYFRRSNCVTTDPHFRRFITLERHFHLFGSIHMHRRVLEANRQDVGGNWDEVMERLEWVETTCCQNFSVQKEHPGLGLRKHHHPQDPHHPHLAGPGVPQVRQGRR